MAELSSQNTHDEQKMDINFVKLFKKHIISRLPLLGDH